MFDLLRKLRFGLSLVSFTALLLLGVSCYLVIKGRYLLAFALMLIAAIEAFIYIGRG